MFSDRLAEGEKEENLDDVYELMVGKRSLQPWIKPSKIIGCFFQNFVFWFVSVSSGSK